ncbi:MAG: glycosyltransferase [Lentisphaerae bacterium]|nr:glycosyltransferase [Lentisphaerota bacterium]
MSSTPKVTVLMAVYNGERFLRDAVESILTQTFPDFEFVIVNDGSTDNSRNILLSYQDPRIKIIENDRNIGLVKSLNRGLAVARGDYVARQDADDISLSTRLEKQIAFLETHTDVAILGTQAENIDSKGNLYSRSDSHRACGELAIRWQLLFENPFVHTSVMFRKDLVSRHGGYDESFTRSEDIELWSRLAYEYGVFNLNEVLVRYRVHKTQITLSSEDYSSESIPIVKNIFSRIFTNCMRSDPPPEWIDMWTAISFPHLCDENVKFHKLLDYINSINNHFFVVYPEAREDTEINQLITQMLLRISLNATLKDRIASLRCFALALTRDFPRASRILLKYLVAFILGNNRRYPREIFPER